MPAPSTKSCPARSWHCTKLPSTRRDGRNPWRIWLARVLRVSKTLPAIHLVLCSTRSARFAPETRSMSAKHISRLKQTKMPYLSALCCLCCAPRSALVRQLHTISATCSTSFLESANRLSKQHKVPQIVTDGQSAHTLVSGISATCLSLLTLHWSVFRDDQKKNTVGPKKTHGPCSDHSQDHSSPNPSMDLLTQTLRTTRRCIVGQQ